MAEPSFTLGIEEEYLLVERAGRELVVDPPEALMAECERRLEGRVSPEFLQSQIEVGTAKHARLKTAATELRLLRATVAEVAEGFGLAPIAASTHPFAAWESQKATPKERYLGLQRDMEAVARRLVICGMHVHVGLDDDDLRLSCRVERLNSRRAHREYPHSGTSHQVSNVRLRASGAAAAASR